MIKLEFNSEPATFKPSKASPPDKEPSPIKAITFSFFPSKSLAFARPVAKEIEVEVCPTLNKSCSLSSGFVYPESSLKCASSIYPNFLPVNILCG